MNATPQANYGQQTDAVVPFLRRSKRWTDGKGKKNSVWILRISALAFTRYTQARRRCWKFVVCRAMLTCATRNSRAQPASAWIPPGLMSHRWPWRAQCNNDNIWNSAGLFSRSKRIVSSRQCCSLVGERREPTYSSFFIFQIFFYHRRQFMSLQQFRWRRYSTSEFVIINFPG